MPTRTKVTFVVLSILIVALVILENLAIRFVFPNVSNPSLALQIIGGLLLALANAAVALAALALAGIRREQNEEAARAHYLSHIIHQLRTPLTTIRWGLDLLRDPQKTAPSEFTKILAELRERNESAIHAVNDILIATRIDRQSRHDAVTSGADARAIITELLPRFQLAFQRKRITPITELGSISSSLGPLAIGPADLSILIENLLENAVSYTPDGGRVTIRAARGTLGVEITVSDTGIGIPHHQRERIGEKFFRADNAQRTLPTGTGLGLYIVRKILAGCDGHFTVTSVEGKGSAFTIVIPYIK